MTDEHFDALLKQALIECIKRDWLEPPLAPEIDAWNTDKLDKRIATLSENPVRYIKAVNRPWYMKTLRSAAAVLIAISILFAASMLNPPARAWFRNLIKKWFGNHNEYSYSDRYSQPINSNWIFRYIPEGFKLTYEDCHELDCYAEYINSDGQIISISIYSDSGTMHLDNEHYEIRSEKIGNDMADVYISTDPLFSNAVIWHSTEYDVLISILGDVEPVELIKVAEGIHS